MSSTFMGINIAVRGLYASQAGAAVTSNNISNMNTEGYSRQTVNQIAAGPAAIYSSRGCVGAGSYVVSVDRISNFRLDQKYWRENGSLGEWETKANALSEIESILGEPSGNGFNTTMEAFYSALEDLAKDPSSSSARSVLKQAGISVCQYLNTAAEQLTQLRDDANNDVKAIAESINAYAQQIADLNQQIRKASAVGANTNELEDQRGVLIDNLSKLVNIEVSEVVVGKLADGTDDKILTICVNGNSLVTDGKARQLECYEIQDGSEQNGMYGLRWQDTNEDFKTNGGSLQAYLDIRDGTEIDGDYKGIPYYINQLDEFARTFAKSFNEGVYKDGTAYYAGHAGGLGADGSQDIRFFSFDDYSSADLLASGSDLAEIYNNITAANISLSQDILDDLNKIAAASTTGGSENNENINDLISICQDRRLFNKGTPEDFMNSIISTLGTDSSYAQRLYENKTGTVSIINDRRDSVSGVSLNEETAYLTKYQQAYDAAANLIAVWDEIYQETINLLSD